MPLGPILRKYGVQTTINFQLFEVDGVDFRIDAADGGTDCSIMKDEGAEATCENDFTDEGQGYSLVLSATEMSAARIVVYVVDSATKAWLDEAIVIETYGNASAMHAVDLDDSVRAGLTALPNAAADAAGGLPISDAGGLDLDTQLAATNEVTAARMGALTDWIDGGRLDLLLDAIKVVTDNLTDLDAIADAVWDEILTGATHNIATSAGRRLRQIQEAQGYENGSIWIDTVNGTAGTVDYENGTVENPVDSIADANTIAASLNMSQFTMISGSSITLAAAQQNQTFFGHNWTLALGGQAIGGTFFQGAVVSGIGTGTGYLFVNCEIGTVTLAAGTCKECRFTSAAGGGFTISAAATLHFLDCKSAIAGSGAPIWTFPGAGSSFLNFRNYSGGIQFEAMTVNDTATIESRGQFIEGTCTAGTVVMRGTQTISGITNITLTDDARFDQTQVFAAVMQTVLTQPTDVATMDLSAENLLYANFKRFFYEHVITVATGVLAVKNADDSEFSAQATVDNGTIQEVGKGT